MAKISDLLSPAVLRKQMESYAADREAISRGSGQQFFNFPNIQNYAMKHGILPASTIMSNGQTLEEYQRCADILISEFAVNMAVARVEARMFMASRYEIAISNRFTIFRPLRNLLFQSLVGINAHMAFQSVKRRLMFAVCEAVAFRELNRPGSIPSDALIAIDEIFANNKKERHQNYLGLWRASDSGPLKVACDCLMDSGDDIGYLALRATEKSCSLKRVGEILDGHKLVGTFKFENVNSLDEYSAKYISPKTISGIEHKTGRERFNALRFASGFRGWC